MSAPNGYISRDRLTGWAMLAAGLIAAVVLAWVIVDSRAADARHDAELAGLIDCQRRFAAVQDKREDLANAIRWTTPAEWADGWSAIRRDNPLPVC